jgi:hypothetical protein
MYYYNTFPPLQAYCLPTHGIGTLSLLEKYLGGEKTLFKHPILIQKKFECFIYKYEIFFGICLE